ALKQNVFSRWPPVFWSELPRPTTPENDDRLRVHRLGKVERRIVLGEARYGVGNYGRCEQPQRNQSDCQQHTAKSPLPPYHQRPDRRQNQRCRRRQQQAANHGLQDEVHGSPTSSSLTLHKRSATVSSTASGEVNKGARRQSL